MKKLNKLLFNTEKIINSEELLLLRGGYDEDNCGVSCSSDFNCTGGKCPKCHETAGGWPRPTCQSM
jgi:natural product precursor